MAMRIYVGGLPYSTTNDDLLRAFSAYGEVVEAVVASDRETGRSKGFGFVQMTDDAAAQSAIAGLDGSDLGGRTITVNLAGLEKIDRGLGRSERTGLVRAAGSDAVGHAGERGPKVDATATCRIAVRRPRANATTAVSAIAGATRSR